MLSKFKMPFIIFSLLLLCAPSLLFKLKGSCFFTGSDLPAYYAAAKLMTSGRAVEVYKPETVNQEARKYFPELPKDRQLCFVAEPPMVMPVFAIFSVFSPRGAKVFCKAIGVMAMVTAVILLAETFELQTKETTTLLLLTAFSAPYWAVNH